MEQNSKGGGSKMTPISPTYLSSDLLTPAQLRDTAPSAGYQATVQAPLGGKTWGDNTTRYGGIGTCRFLGQERTGKDLFVSRSHRHYSSGFSVYDTDVQPSQVTSLMKSECRINDQLLPPPLHVALDPRTYTWPQQTEVNPYFSHRCKHEVFPRLDPERLDAAGGPVLTERTRAGLADYYHSLQTMRYDNTFADHTEVVRETARQGPLGADQRDDPYWLLKNRMKGGEVVMLEPLRAAAVQETQILKNQEGPYERKRGPYFWEKSADAEAEESNSKLVRAGPEAGKAVVTVCESPEGVTGDIRTSDIQEEGGSTQCPAQEDEEEIPQQDPNLRVEQNGQYAGHAVWEASLRAAVEAARDSFCLKDLLLHVCEARGMQVTRDVVDHLARASECLSPLCRFKFSTFFGSHANHMFREVRRVVDFLGYDFTGVALAVASCASGGGEFRDATEPVRMAFSCDGVQPKQHFNNKYSAQVKMIECGTADERVINTESAGDDVTAIPCGFTVFPNSLLANRVAANREAQEAATKNYDGSGVVPSGQEVKLPKPTAQKSVRPSYASTVQQRVKRNSDDLRLLSNPCQYPTFLDAQWPAVPKPNDLHSAPPSLDKPLAVSAQAAAATPARADCACCGAATPFSTPVEEGRCDEEPGAGVAGKAPLWPPGSYITNKPWMALQCTCQYPPWPTQECQRRKTGVDSALFTGATAAPSVAAASAPGGTVLPPISSSNDAAAPCSNQEEPAPLAASLQPTGTRIVDQLGLPFRTAARKRFHALYKDPQADLRDNCRFRKRNFFFGYHGSAFRGNTQTDVIHTYA